MRKSVMIVLVAMLLAAVPSRAQAIGSLEEFYYFVTGDQVAWVTAGNLRMVENLQGQLYRAQIRNVRGQRVWGYEDGEGEFTPLHEDAGGKPGRRINWGRAAGIAGTCATVARMATGDWMYTGIAAAGCFGGSILVDKAKGGKNDKNEGRQTTSNNQSSSVRPTAAPVRQPVYRSAGQPVTCVTDCEKLENTSPDRLYVTIRTADGQVFVDTETGITWENYVVLGGKTIRIPYIHRGWTVWGDFDAAFVDNVNFEEGRRDSCPQRLYRVQGFGWRSVSRCDASN